MKVYIASSWKNVTDVRRLARTLRAYGHAVFDFTDPASRPDGTGGFVFSASQWFGKPLHLIHWLEFAECEATRLAYESDRSGLDWAEAVVLLLPCGRSAHLEAGYAAGRGKRLVVCGTLPRGEFEAMYLLADLRTERLDEVLTCLEAWR